MGLWEAVLRRLQGSGGGTEEAAPDSSGYRAVWSPSNDTDAMGLILNETDAGKFEASGRHDAEGGPRPTYSIVGHSARSRLRNRPRDPVRRPTVP